MSTKKPKSAPRTEIQGTVVLQTNFYRDQFKKLVFICLIIFITCIATLLLVIGLVVYTPKDIKFPSDYRAEKSSSPAISQFSITPRVPTNQPNMSQPELLQWLVDAVIHSFSYDSQLYPQQSASNKIYYSQAGWSEYVRILHNMIDFDTLTSSQNLICTIEPLGAPISTHQGESEGIYAWVFEIPVKIQFTGTLAVPGQKMTLRIVVSRIPMDTNIDGILITSMAASNVDIQRRAVAN